MVYFDIRRDLLDQAHRITGKQQYLDALQPLLERDGDFSVGFPRSIANGQQVIPLEYSFSDDQLAFLGYGNLLLGARSSNSSASLVEVARKGVARSWDAVAHERAAIWNIMALASLMQTGG